MRYHLNLKMLMGKKKYTFFKAAILSRKQDEYRNNFYTIVLRIFWASIWHLDPENWIKGSGEIHHLICSFFFSCSNFKKISNIDTQLTFSVFTIMPLNFSAFPDPIFLIKVSNWSSEHSQYNAVAIQCSAFCSWENKLSNKPWLVTVRSKLTPWEAF